MSYKVLIKCYHIVNNYTCFFGSKKQCDQNQAMLVKCSKSLSTPEVVLKARVSKSSSLGGAFRRRERPTSADLWAPCEQMQHDHSWRRSHTHTRTHAHTHARAHTHAHTHTRTKRASTAAKSRFETKPTGRWREMRTNQITDLGEVSIWDSFLWGERTPAVMLLHCIVMIDALSSCQDAQC